MGQPSTNVSQKIHFRYTSVPYVVTIDTSTDVLLWGHPEKMQAKTTTLKIVRAHLDGLQPWQHN